MEGIAGTVFSLGCCIHKSGPATVPPTPPGLSKPRAPPSAGFLFCLHPRVLFTLHRMRWFAKRRVRSLTPSFYSQFYFLLA